MSREKMIQRIVDHEVYTIQSLMHAPYSVLASHVRELLEVDDLEDDQLTEWYKETEND